MSPNDIARIEAELNLKLPPHYVEYVLTLLDAHARNAKTLNQKGLSHGSVPYVDADAMIRANHYHRSAIEERDPFWLGEERRPWTFEGIVIGENGGGNYCFIKKDPADTSVYWWDHETFEIETHHDSLAVLFAEERTNFERCRQRPDWDQLPRPQSVFLLPVGQQYHIESERSDGGRLTAMPGTPARTAVTLSLSCANWDPRLTAQTLASQGVDLPTLKDSLREIVAALAGIATDEVSVAALVDDDLGVKATLAPLPWDTDTAEAETFGLFVLTDTSFEIQQFYAPSSAPTETEWSRLKRAVEKLLTTLYPAAVHVSVGDPRELETPDWAEFILPIRTRVNKLPVEVR